MNDQHSNIKGVAVIGGNHDISLKAAMLLQSLTQAGIETAVAADNNTLHIRCRDDIGLSKLAIEPISLQQMYPNGRRNHKPGGFRERLKQHFKLKKGNRR